jgi:hypothetical protein
VALNTYIKVLLPGQGIYLYYFPNGIGIGVFPLVYHVLQCRPMAPFTIYSQEYTLFIVLVAIACSVPVVCIGHMAFQAGIGNWPAGRIGGKIGTVYPAVGWGIIRYL